MTDHTDCECPECGRPDILVQFSTSEPVANDAATRERVRADAILYAHAHDIPEWICNVAADTAHALVVHGCKSNPPIGLIASIMARDIALAIDVHWIREALPARTWDVDTFSAAVAGQWVESIGGDLSDLIATHVTALEVDAASNCANRILQMIGIDDVVFAAVVDGDEERELRLTVIVERCPTVH